MLTDWNELAVLRIAPYLYLPVIDMPGVILKSACMLWYMVFMCTKLFGLLQLEKSVHTSIYIIYMYICGT